MIEHVPQTIEVEKPWGTFEQYVKAAWEPVVKGQLAGALSQGGVWQDNVATAAVTAKPAPVEVAPAKLEGDAGGFALLAYPSL